MKKTMAILGLLICSKVMLSQTLVLSGNDELTFDDFNNCDTLMIDYGLACYEEYLPKREVSKKEALGWLFFHRIDKYGNPWPTSRIPRKGVYKDKTIILFSPYEEGYVILNK